MFLLVDMSDRKEMQNTENISELINIFSKVSRYRVNTEILLIFYMPKRNVLRKKLEMVRHLKKLKKTLKDGMSLRGIDRINIVNGLYYQKDRQTQCNSHQKSNDFLHKSRKK